MRSLFYSFLILTVWAVALPANAAKPVFENSYMREYKADGSFEEVRDALKLAITGQGLVINNVSHIGNMLSRTGKDIGAKQEIYEHAEAMEFCSASISRTMMEANPRHIVFCPFIIAVYTLPGEPGKTYLAYRKPEITGSPESKKALQAVEKLVDNIVQDALGW
ncbi:MAG: DUF302 domain-containing protein [Gammaproteobacteria bacterium]|nr:DUF302 domain-containing protein [Gammaproteobacteria bacterium]